MPEGQVLEFSGVTKRFGAVTAVSDFSARVEPGLVTGFLGPNGAGKTTSLRILLGLVRATGGTATIGGAPYSSLARPLQSVGAVLEASSFHPGRTAANHLKVYAQAAGLPVSRVAETLGLVGLADVGGPQGRWVLARDASAARTRVRAPGRSRRPRSRRARERPRSRGHQMDARLPPPARARGPNSVRVVAPARRGAADGRLGADHLAGPARVPGRARGPRRSVGIRHCRRLARSGGAERGVDRRRCVLRRAPLRPDRARTGARRSGRDRGIRRCRPVVAPSPRPRARRGLPRSGERRARASHRRRRGRGRFRLRGRRSRRARGNDRRGGCCDHGTCSSGAAAEADADAEDAEAAAIASDLATNTGGSPGAAMAVGAAAGAATWTTAEPDADDEPAAEPPVDAAVDPAPSPTFAVAGTGVIDIIPFDAGDPATDAYEDDLALDGDPDVEALGAIDAELSARRRRNERGIRRRRPGRCRRRPGDRP